MPTLTFRGRSFIEPYSENLPHYALIPHADLSVLPDGAQPSLSGNLLIEGDNLLALQSLLPHFKGRIKCIYIDPPYNTGNEHWVYNDNVSGAIFKEWLGQEVGPQGEDFNRHDKWCCMMYPRLQMLRELLREDGVIFVSIDDNEVHHLRMLMDEIFGEENLLAQIVWQKKYAPANDATDFSWTHDYIIVYANERHFDNTGKPIATIGRRERSEEQNKLYKNPDNDPRGVWASDNYLGSKTPEQRPNLNYPIKHPKTGILIYPTSGLTWRYSKEKHELHIKENRIWWGANQENEVPRYKRFLIDVRDVVAGTWWTHTQYGHNDEARKELKAVLGELADNTTPKPSRLLREIIKLVVPSESEDDIILDSFAGSGTTAHAVLQLNAEDGGNRRFITVQMPYDNKADETAGRNIARDITRERIRRVIAGVGEKVPALGGSFTYATLSDEPLCGYYGVLRPGTAWDELASYVWQTETLSAFDPAGANRETGLVGRTAGNIAAYYLFYTPDPDGSNALDYTVLPLLARDPAEKIIVYAEKLLLDPDVQKNWQRENRKMLRDRIVPTQLR